MATATRETVVGSKDIIPESRIERSRDMVGHLEVYTNQLTEALIEEEMRIRGGNRRVFEAQIRARIEKAKAYFVSVDKERGVTPIERIAQVYEYLEIPSDPQAARQMHRAIQIHSQELIERAFDQHFENPEQYVSHGFDHSLNVADYTRKIIEQNPDIVSSMTQAYGVSGNEAKFMLENVALCHDCGYCQLGQRAKAVHAIAGADIISSDKMRGLYTQMVGVRLAPGQRDLLLHDFRESIMYHNADTIQRLYDVRILTTMGEFLVDRENVLNVVSTFNRDKNDLGHAREATTIYVQDEATRVEIADALHIAGLDTWRKAGENPQPVSVRVLAESEQESLRGRVLDLQHKGDRQIGLEYREVDALVSPMHAAIRLADNMDMRTNRFSEVQQEPAFQELYRRFGDNGPESLTLQQLESLRNDTELQLSKLPETNADGTPNSSRDAIGRDAVARAQEALRQSIRQEEQDIFGESFAGITNPSQAEVLWKTIVVERVLNKPEYQGLSQEKRDRIRDLALAHNSESIRHFGGCEPIANLLLVGSKLTITVDAQRYTSLNMISVFESSLDKHGDTSRVAVGVGEYQIWRLKQAYSSITIGGRKIDIALVDQNGNEVLPTKAAEVYSIN